MPTLDPRTSALVLIDLQEGIVAGDKAPYSSAAVVEAGRQQPPPDSAGRPPRGGLRRRGIRTVAVAGIATNLGVESTVRAGWELGYDMVVVEDACTTYSAAMQSFAFEHILPRIARVSTTDALSLGED